MSSIEILERFNQASRDTIDASPKIRKKAINELIVLYYDAPVLKVSVVSKLEQLQGDADEDVSKYAKRMLERVKSGRGYSPYYTPMGSRAPSTGEARGTGQGPREVKNVVANIVCCIVMVVIYFIFYFFVF